MLDAEYKALLRRCKADTCFIPLNAMRPNAFWYRLPVAMQMQTADLRPPRDVMH